MTGDSRDFFGFAQGTDVGRYLGFSFGQRTSLFMAASLLLIGPASASAHQQALDAAQHAAEAEAQAPSTGVTPISTGTGALPLHINDLTRVTQAAVGAAVPQPIKKQFHAAEVQERGV
jgi:hypothetical protein